MIIQNLGIKQIIEHYKQNRKIVIKDNCKNISGTSQCQQCVVVKIIMADIQPFVSGRRTFLHEFIDFAPFND